MVDYADVKPAERINELTQKQRLWLKYYLDPDCGFNATTAARLAGYAPTRDPDKPAYWQLRVQGSKNLKRCKLLIEKWLDQEGLSEAVIKRKIIAGMNANETKFFVHEGRITEEVNVEALAIQQKYVELACKVKGLLVSSVEVTGKDGGPLEINLKWPENGNGNGGGKEN